MSKMCFISFLFFSFLFFSFLFFSFLFFSFTRVLQSVRLLISVTQRCFVLFSIWFWHLDFIFVTENLLPHFLSANISTSWTQVCLLVEIHFTDQCQEKMSWTPVFSSSGSYCSLHNPGWRFGDYFLQTIGYVDSGFVLLKWLHVVLLFVWIGGWQMIKLCCQF